MIQYTANTQIYQTVCYIIVLAISLLLRYFLKNKSPFIKRLPLYILGGIIIALEIGKQIRNFSGYNYRYLFAMFRGLTNEFDAYALPFHFCSFFIFFCLFQIIFMKNKKLGPLFDNLTFVWATLIAILVMFYPDMIYGVEIEEFVEGRTEFMHPLLFHGLVLLYWGIALALRTYKFSIKQLYQAPICMLIYGAFAIPASHITKQNFCSIYNYEGWDFLAGVFEKGYFVYDGLLVIIGMVVSTIIYLAILGEESLRDKVKDSSWYFAGYVAMIPAFIILLLISKTTGYTVLQPLYSVWLVLVCFICCLPATIRGHLKAILKK